MAPTRPACCWTGFSRQSGRSRQARPRTTTSPRSYCGTADGLGELLQRVLLGFERVEDGQQLGDRQQIVQTLGEVQELHAAACFRYRRIGADELAKAGAIHVG